ncbi:UDP-glucose flavonoid 3-O-glucosyltransferase 7-like [Rosa rugosa]|uniref:UDP-glucose flavonoid 3-O-glucosyltransferase 7-like n=1 Tax=Rosa rugosa TaxID=74645 RepID=UPI002B408A99|nr:UDP-glucose flavonoid 3-O-glucosyltransferase 7-like [Rosa rugosa]XP_062024344.1 UDP-glucose flavonoid 3-O-glucosyltransferase 7-like [Rosa rugosa]
METKSLQQLHIFFLPFMARGHSIPIIDIAKLFSSRGARCTIVTTPLNAPLFSKATQRGEVKLVLIKFPSTEAGLPQDCEDPDLIRTQDMVEKFVKATYLLEPQLEQVLDEHRPHCLVADGFFPWATDVAAKFGIPRLYFHGIGFFPLCASLSVMMYQPQTKLSSDSESFVIPNLPDEIKMNRSQLPVFPNLDGESEFLNMLKASTESEERSYGVIVNSFYELEPAYADHYRKVFRRKAWHIGPVSLCNKAPEDKAERGAMESSTAEKHECLKWLDSKKPHSVVYISFGSIICFADCQLLEIAIGLEASGQDFIWVVKKEKKDEEDWLPEGFEKRTEGKGLIIRDWAPQVLILEHEAIGAFVTHCGWNSTIEGVSAGVPMITWPVMSDEQFYNEKLVTEILRIGVPVGSEQWVSFVDLPAKTEASVRRGAIEKAVTRIMVGDEAVEMRSRIKELGEKARRAVEEGGSSFLNLISLVEELNRLLEA